MMSVAAIRVEEFREVTSTLSFESFNLLTYLFIYLLTYLITYLLTYLLIPWSRVLLEKLTGSQIVKKFPACYGTWRFITELTSARQLSLSRAKSIQSIPPHPTSCRSISILSYNLRLGLPRSLFPQVSQPKPCIQLSSPHTCYMSHPSYSSRFDHPNNIWWGVQIIKFLIM